jgi:tyrosyl-tRNA synthetase
MTIEEKVEKLVSRTAEVISPAELVEKFKKAEKEGRPLRVKLGADPTAPDLHLGHAVVLRKLRQFQDFGAKVYFVIGDFTAMIGDPTGRNKTRKPLSREQIKENAKTYLEQVYKILIPEMTEVVYNSQWLEPLGAADVITKLASKYTVARILERDDFDKRMKAGIPIYIHEILYPLFQGYDSVALEADVEMGGTDQIFNLLVGRDLQREYGQDPQVVFTMPIIEGLDGVKKMSKSLGNYVAFNDEPKDMFGKIMSIPDALMKKYYELLTDFSDAEIEEILKGHPRDAKMKLAYTITAFFHGEDAAAEAQEHFVKVFSKKEMPDEMPEIKFSDIVPDAEEIRLVDFLVKAGLLGSKGEAKRIIKGGGVKIDGNVITDIAYVLYHRDEPQVLRIGKKRFYKIV